MITRPMKPYKLITSELAVIRYPVIGTPKIDGIRCTKVNGLALTASHKPIPNRCIASYIERREVPDGFDGELVTPGTFQETVSAVMSLDGQPPFKWLVFDYVIDARATYVDRLADLSTQLSTRAYPFLEMVTPTLLNSELDLLRFEEAVLIAGYEGIVVRALTSPYKNGRSTLREQGMLALKRFVDAEAVVTGVTPKFHNSNVATLNELGLTHRSHHADGRTALDTLGALRVRDIRTGIEFSVGTGFTDYQRSLLWANPPIGKLIKYKSLPHGVKDAPRHPVFLGFRAIEDMTLSSPLGEGSQNIN